MSRTSRLLVLAFLPVGVVLASAVLPGDDPLDGVVRERQSGSVVASARVELRAEGRLLAAARTDPDGRFRLDPGEARGAIWEVRVLRLGYAQASVVVAPGTTSLEILLDPTPLPLPEFTVEGEAEICERAEDPEARHVWRRAAARHQGGLDTLGVATYTLARTDTLAADGLPNMETDRARPGQRASAPLLRLSWSRRVERDGYAFRVRRSDRQRSYDSWSYAPLEADFAPHFVDEAFGRLHDFHLERSDAAGWVVHFCGRRTDRPHLDGILEVGSDTLIHRAEWRFQTPDPDEGAGGWARFLADAVDDGMVPLLPTESMVWRSLPDDQVLRRVQWYEEWIVAPGDSVPFLPERRAQAAP